MAPVDETGDESDLALLSRWKAGDRRAGNRLVERYFDQIRRYFLNAVGDQEREDLVQETFQRLLKAVDSFEHRSSFRTFLFSIARRALFDYFRRRGRGKGDFDPLLHSVEDGGVSPSHIVTAIERHQQLLACIRKLPLETKQLLELYYWHDLTGGELAEAAGVRERTLRTRLAAARKLLCKCMAAASGIAVEHDDAALEEQLRELGEFFATGRVRG